MLLLLFTADLPAISPRNATQLLQDFVQFNPSLRPRKEGGYWLTVPSGRAPLRTQRALKEFCRGRYQYQWTLYGLDDEGCPTIPISEETA
jgi:hypothetical protein